MLRSVRWKKYLISLLHFVVTSTSIATNPNIPMRLEQSVCGVKEPIYFWLWSTVAGRPNSKRLSGLDGVVDISFRTQDGRTLRGYKLDTSKTLPPQMKHARGFLLVLQGNAMLADQILGEYRAYAHLGYDVYIYDYRGYGRSEGKRRLKAIVHDIKELLTSLIAQDYEERFVYAMSLGGVFLLNALEPDMQLDKIIIDSTPSRLCDYGCPIEYDPIEHLPDDCGNILLVTGQRDNVVTPAMSKDLARKAEDRNAIVISDPEFSHPFMDANATIHQRRMQEIQRYFLR
jgi:alpha/beta superfamily hydrolase